MSKIITKSRAIQIASVCSEFGEEVACEVFGFKPNTLRRRLREAKANYNISVSKTAIIKKIEEAYTGEELKAIAHGGRVLPGQSRVPIISFTGEHIKFGAISDTHHGSIYSREEHIYQAFEEFKREKVEFITHCGDVTEGMSGRAGHVYELSHIGYTAQKEYAQKIYEQTPAKIYFIDGNHDRWYVKSNGAYIVKEICETLGEKRATYLGSDEGNISLRGRTTLKLWHGEDGNTYALSYRLQKVIESLSGGEKPGVMIAGHVHKALYIFERNIHCFGGGTLQMQSKWMRSKRLAAHVGFWIIDVWVAKSGVTKIKQTWYPFYA